MNFLDALHISSSGLAAQRLRMNLISSNLANINTTRTPQGGPYRRREAIFSALPVRRSFHNVLRSQVSGRLPGVRVVGFTTDHRPPILKHDPSHPDADKRGYVAMPNINIIEEMVNDTKAKQVIPIMVAFLYISTALLWGYIAQNATTNSMRQEAIENGVAELVVTVDQNT